jgi:hypothetical protein
MELMFGFLPLSQHQDGSVVCFQVAAEPFLLFKVEVIWKFVGRGGYRHCFFDVASVAPLDQVFTKVSETFARGKP